jgi:CRISPR-associated protein Cas2
VLITVVISLEKVPDRLRGELSRWMIEVTTGVFVADLSATVRDLLWKKCETKLEQGRCALMFRTNNEQGFTLKLSGDFNRSISEMDGLQFIALHNARWQDWLEEEAKRRPKPPEPEVQKKEVLKKKAQRSTKKFAKSPAAPE